MDRLPLEIKTSICSLLDHRGLAGFSAANKHCNQAARPVLFAHLRISFTTPEALQARITDILATLQRASSLQHVRSMEVVAANVSSPYHVADLDCGDRPQDLWQCYAPYADPSLTIEHDSDWLPLAQMVNQTSGLRRLSWGCLQQVAPCVLQALTLRHCDLDIPSFSLRSLLRPPPEPIDIDAHELALATSSLLRSLCLRFDFRNDGLSNYNYYAVMDMARGAAPNLQKVALLYESSGSSFASYQTMGMRDQPWRHDVLKVPRLNETTIGQLKCLELCVRETGDALREWSTTTDFSALHTLKLHSWMDANIFRWLISECHWSKLTALAITPKEDDESALDDLYSATQAFLKSIPPLRYLKITRHYDQATLQVALQVHGQTLRQLLLTGEDKTWLISIETIELIRQHCPVLEELYIPVQRYAGSVQEVAVYRALGSLPAIKRIYISFQQTDVRFPVVSYNRQGQPKPTDHDNRIALVNFAVDEQLAKAIFSTISSSKRPGLPLLEHLELRAEDRQMANYRGYDFDEYVLDCLRRSWTCERATRDDCPAHECITWESDPEKVLDREYEDRYGTYDFSLDSEIGPIFRSIWPGDGPWKDAWYSLPLDRG